MFLKVLRLTILKPSAYLQNFKLWEDPFFFIELYRQTTALIFDWKQLVLCDIDLLGIIYGWLFCQRNNSYLVSI